MKNLNNNGPATHLSQAVGIKQTSEKYNRKNYAAIGSRTVNQCPSLQRSIINA